MNKIPFGIQEKIESIIFDFDGVLVESDELHWQAYQLVFSKYDIPFSIDDYRERAKGCNRDVVIKRFLSHLNLEEQRLAFEKKGEATRALFARGDVKPVTGVVNFIHIARSRGLLCAVGSTSELAEFAIDTLGMTHLFEYVSSKRSEDQPKPHPDVFLRAIQQLGCPAQNCLVIEDTPVGARAALNAETQVIIRKTTDTSRLEKMPKAIRGAFETYTELPTLLGWEED